MQKASGQDLVRNQQAESTARSTFVVSQSEEEETLQRMTAPPKSLQRVDPTQPTAAAALGSSVVYRARSTWEGDANECETHIDVAEVQNAGSPEWETWRLAPALQLVPSTTSSRHR